MTKIATIQEETEDILKRLDYIVVVDHSTSMGNKSHRFSGKTRLQEIEEEVLGIARQAQAYDDDGITVIAFASTVSVHDGVTADDVENTFKEFPPRGSTDLAAAIKAVAEKTRHSTKEVVAIVYTDGVPNDYDAVVTAINNAAKEFGRPKIGFTLIQVGQDDDAKRFLEKLDDEKLDDEPKIDVVSTVTEEESESLTLPQIVWLARHA